MRTDSFYLFLKKYINDHPNDFIACHETNNPATPEKIIETGLRVSHSPYGKKIRRCIDDHGKIDLDRAFMATMTPVNNKNIDQNKFYLETPTAPIVINIPDELLKIALINPTDEDAHKFFCSYGFEEPLTGTDRCGKITPLSPENKNKANVRFLPSFLVAGHFNPENGEFIENNKHFSKLPKEEQDKIIQECSSKYKIICQNQPQ